LQRFDDYPASAPPREIASVLKNGSAPAIPVEARHSYHM